MSTPIPAPDDRRCHARSKRTGQRCAQYAMPGKRVCKWHGGESPAGIAHYKADRLDYSKVLPNRLLTTYKTALADPELYNLRSDASLLKSFLFDVLAKAERGEAGELWMKCQASWDAMIEAQAAGDQQGASRHLAQIGRYIQRGSADHLARKEAREIVQEHKKIVESERRRLVEMQQLLTTEQAMAFMAAITALVQEHVHDRDALAAISAGLTRLAADGRRGVQTQPTA